MKKRRMVALLLSAAMTFSALPQSVIAEEAEVNATAIGSSEDAVTSESAIDVDTEVGESLDTAPEEVSVDDVAVEAMSLGDGQWSVSSALEEGSDFSVTQNDTSATLKILKVGKGKATGSKTSTDENLAMLLHEVSAQSDFVLTGTLNVDGYNNLSGDSNPGQTGYGIGVFNQEPHYNTDTEKNVNNLMIQGYQTSNSAATSAIGGFVRGGASSKLFADPEITYAEFEAASGTDLGSFPFEVKKSGTVYKLTCNGKSWTYDASTLFTNDSVYVGFFVARNAAITVSDINFEEDSRVATNLKINSLPNKLSYAVNEDGPDLTGLEVEATYSNGETEILNNDDLTISGFDTTTKGDKVMTIVKGDITADINYTVAGVSPESIEVVYEPVVNEYYIGTRFETTGLTVKAHYPDGSEETLTEDKYELYLDGTTPINVGDLFTSSMVGEHNVVIKRATDASYDTGSASGSYKIDVLDYTIDSLYVYTAPTKVEYSVGDDFDQSGLRVRAIYAGADGNKFSALKDDEYTISGFDSSKAGDIYITITSVDYPNISTTQLLKIKDVNPLDYVVTYYPRLTYEVGEDFDFDDMVVSVLYSNNQYVATTKYALLDTEGNAAKLSVDADEYNALAQAQYPENYDSDPENDVEVTGVTKTLVIHPTDEALADLADVNLDLTIRPASTTERVWKDVVFGASAKRANNTVKHNSDGSVTVASINGGGKMTNDNDGICYYYTTVDASNNFIIDAEITVDYYLNDTNDDTLRNGQEGFGIMARDIIPLQATDGSAYTIYSQYANKDENGVAIPSESMQGVTFSSNMVMVGGTAAGQSWPSATSLNYEKYANRNRINLYARSGVADPESGAGTKQGPWAVSSTFPKVGNRYRVTLQKVGDTYHATCWDYQTLDENGNPKKMESTQTIEKLLTYQNSDEIFVGFFASRYAKITVSNYSCYETDPSTDEYFAVKTETEYAPGVSLESSNFSSTQNYSLMLKATNPSGGNADIRLNDKLVYRGVSITKKSSKFDLTLEKNKTNTVTVSYTASSGDLLTSTDTVVSRYEIVECENVPDTEIIYCSPDGTADGDGTRANPLDVRTAIGLCSEGQTIVLLEGTYAITSELRIPKINSGFESAYKRLIADDGAKVVFDMQNKSNGIVLIGDYWEINGIEFCNSANNERPFDLSGNYDIVKNCKFHDNGDTGFQVSRTGDAEGIENWPTGNQIINCESWNNADPSGINADGFGAKLTVGLGTVFEGCVSHHNLDDGWDTFTKTGTGAIGPVTLINCISYKQGYKLNEDGTEKAYASGGHNGFKMGGENVAVQHYLQDCISFENSNGITSNSNPAMKIRGFVSYNNSGSNFALYTNSPQGKAQYNYDLKYCVSYRGSSNDRIGTYTTDTDYTNGTTTPVESENNYWNGTNSLGDTVTDSFFKSVKKTDSLTNGRYSQDTDGTFIKGDFLARADGFSYGDSDEAKEEASTTESTETTTVRATTSGGGGGGGGGSSKATTTTTTTEATTVEEDTEVSTEDREVTTDSAVETATAVAFDDIASRAWAVDAITKLANAGIISGVADGKFAPDQYCKRGDFILVVANILGLDTDEECDFTDVAPNKYYANAIMAAKQANIATGYTDGTFKPEDTITRQDMMVLVVKALEYLGVETNDDTAILDSFADANDISDYAKPYVAILANSKFVSGTDKGIEPKANITRAQMACLVAPLYELVTPVIDEASEVETVDVTDEDSDVVTEETTEETTAVTRGKKVVRTTEATTETTTSEEDEQ
jgi:hypothetical protein